MEIKVRMIESDFKGDVFDPWDCPGSRAFKRGCKRDIPWYNRLFMSYAWSVYKSISGKWRAYKNGSPIAMHTEAKVGDQIIFIKGFKR